MMELTRDRAGNLLAALLEAQGEMDREWWDGDSNEEKEGMDIMRRMSALREQLSRIYYGE